MKTSVQRAQSIVGDVKEGRPEHDFYPTPRNVTVSLLEQMSYFKGGIWECACGKGDISQVLEEYKHRVVSTDLINYGFGLGEIDFLATKKLLAPNIVTNPPFKLAAKFAEHAMDLGAEIVCLLCKLAFLESEERRKLFMKYPPEWVYVFSKRIQLTRNGEPPRGGGMIAFAWFVWRKDWHGNPSVDWI